MALLKLSDHYSVVRLEDACRKALTFTPSPSLKSVQAILKSEQDLLQTEDVDPEPVPRRPTGLPVVLSTTEGRRNNVQ